MCSAALPAYWLARMLVRPLYALVVALSSIAGGWMLYHGTLTSESAAYPVFVLTVAVCVRALAAPSRGRDVAALAVLGLAVATRAQFVVLPLVFFVALVVVGRPLRRHVVAVSGLALGAIAAAIAGTASLGFYGGARTLDYPLDETLRWTVWTAALLPFAVGMLIAPGALIGLVLGAARPRRSAERAFATVTLLLLALMSLQAGLIASGESHKPFERYVFYLAPLAFLAFFALAERGPAGRKLIAGTALGFAGLALLVPFSSLALTPFSFDSPTISAVETLGRWTSQGDAAAIFAAAGVLAALLAAALRRRPLALAAGSIMLALAVGVAAYSGDRRMTERTLSSLAPAQPDWLERTGIDRADVLALPGGSLHSGWVLESWNRNVARTFHLDRVPHDQLPYTPVGLRPDGTLVDTAGTPVRSEHLVVDDAGTRVDLEARRLATPRDGLTLYRTDGGVRFRSVAFGVYSDGLAQSIVRFRAFARAPVTGAYRVVLTLPAGRAARTVEVEAGPVSRRFSLRSGRPLDIRVPVSNARPPELSVRIDRADFVDAETSRPRLVGARVETLEFTPQKGSRN
jgi:hypothetical protein